jgi:hypothetical protein
VRARIPACNHVRSFAFDEATSILYFGDHCGLHGIDASRLG